MASIGKDDYGSWGMYKDLAFLKVEWYLKVIEHS